MSSDFGEDAIASSRDLSRSLENFLKTLVRQYVERTAKDYAFAEDIPAEEVDSVAFDTSSQAEEFAEHARAMGYEAQRVDRLSEIEQEAFRAGELAEMPDGKVVVMRRAEMAECMAKLDFALSFDGKRPDIKQLAAQAREQAKEVAERSRERADVAHDDRAQDQEQLRERGIDPNAR